LTSSREKNAEKRAAEGKESTAGHVLEREYKNYRDNKQSNEHPYSNQMKANFRQTEQEEEKFVQDDPSRR